MPYSGTLLVVALYVQQQPDARRLRSRMGLARGEVASCTPLGSESNWIAVDSFFVVLRFQAKGGANGVVQTTQRDDAVRAYSHSLKKIGSFTLLSHITTKILKYQEAKQCDMTRRAYGDM